MATTTVCQTVTGNITHWRIGRCASAERFRKGKFNRLEDAKRAVEKTFVEGQNDGTD
jgi:membrane protein YqaA with SNARE-associated domain